MEEINLPGDLKGLIEYHTHLCLGVMIGYKAVQYAISLIGESDNMQVTAESESCGNDAVRYLLNCTKENGKLECNDTKFQCWSFYNHDEEEGVCLSVNPILLNQLPKDTNQAIKYLFELPGDIIFNVEPFYIY